MTATEIVERVRITDVAEALGVRLSSNRRRGRATWRHCQHFSVSFKDAKGSWRDFATNEGGGVLDLVGRVRTRADGLVENGPIRTCRITGRPALTWRATFGA
jgi:hypothetical protein